MSLVDTLAPVILAAGFVLAVLIALGAWAYRLTTESRAHSFASRRNLELERQAFRFIEDLFIEANSDNGLSVTLPDKLNDDLWKLHNQIDQRRELTR